MKKQNHHDGVPQLSAETQKGTCSDEKLPEYISATQRTLAIWRPFYELDIKDGIEVTAFFRSVDDASAEVVLRQYLIGKDGAGLYVRNHFGNKARGHQLVEAQNGLWLDAGANGHLPIEQLIESAELRRIRESEVDDILKDLDARLKHKGAAEMEAPPQAPKTVFTTIIWQKLSEAVPTEEGIYIFIVRTKSKRDDHHIVTLTKESLERIGEIAFIHPKNGVVYWTPMPTL